MATHRCASCWPTRSGWTTRTSSSPTRPTTFPLSASSCGRFAPPRAAVRRCATRQSSPASIAPWASWPNCWARDQEHAVPARMQPRSRGPVACVAGGPVTAASYLIEGRPSRTFAVTKEFMYREPDAFALLLDKLSRVMVGYLQAQVQAGAHALQLFDSWVGALSPADYETRVPPFTRRIFDALAVLEVPRIHFGTNTAGLLPLIASAGADVVSLDWRIDLGEGWRRVGFDRGIQGNLDPAVLLGPRTSVIEGARRVL